MTKTDRAMSRFGLISANPSW